MSVGKGSLQRASKAGKATNMKKEPAITTKKQTTKKSTASKSMAAKPAHTKSSVNTREVKSSVLVPENPKIVSGLICEIPTYLL